MAFLGKLRKPRFSGKMTQDTAQKISLLKESREKRVKTALLAASVGGLSGFGGQTMASLQENPSFRKGVSLAAVWAAGGVLIGAGLGFAAHKREVQRATKLVGRALSEETKNNEAFRKWLGQRRYTIVDKNGNLAGTNRTRVLGIGRIRLENHKILAGTY